MENLKNAFFVITLISIGFVTNAAQTVYIKGSFAHLRDFVTINSSYSRTLVCGTPVEVLEKKQEVFKVKSEELVGYIPRSAISFEVPECFQEKYPKFFQALNIDNADLFYWGKLK